MSLLAVAHRAGNSLVELRAAAELGVDVVEADVHAVRGRLEVRHSKALGPLPWLWDKDPWELVPTSVPQLSLDALLAALPSTATLMLDLKGVGPVGAASARAVLSRPPEQPVLVCARWWPSVDAWSGVPAVRPVLSARHRGELVRLQRRLRAGRVPYGVSLHGSLLSAPVVAQLREQVELVMTWGVEDLAALGRVVDLGVTGVISRNPQVLQAVVAHR